MLNFVHVFDLGVNLGLLGLSFCLSSILVVFNNFIREGRYLKVSDEISGLDRLFFFLNRNFGLDLFLLLSYLGFHTLEKFLDNLHDREGMSGTLEGAVDSVNSLLGISNLEHRVLRVNSFSFASFTEIVISAASTLITNSFNLGSSMKACSRSVASVAEGMVFSRDFSFLGHHILEDGGSDLLEKADSLLELLCNLFARVNNVELLGFLIRALSLKSANHNTIFSTEDPFVANISLLEVRFLRLKELVSSDSILVVEPSYFNLRVGGIGEFHMNSLELGLRLSLSFLGSSDSGIDFSSLFFVNLGTDDRLIGGGGTDVSHARFGHTKFGFLNFSEKVVFDTCVNDRRGFTDSDFRLEIFYSRLLDFLLFSEISHYGTSSEEARLVEALVHALDFVSFVNELCSSFIGRSTGSQLEYGKLLDFKSFLKVILRGDGNHLTVFIKVVELEVLRGGFSKGSVSL